VISDRTKLALENIQGSVFVNTVMTIRVMLQAGGGGISWSVETLVTFKKKTSVWSQSRDSLKSLKITFPVPFIDEEM